MLKDLANLTRILIVGLAIAFVVQIFYPELINHNKVVEFINSGSTTLNSRDSGPVSYADAVDKAAPAVVNIFTKKHITQAVPSIFKDPLVQRFLGDYLDLQPREREERSLGSGVLVSHQGHILTNNHVIDGADTIEIALHDGRTATATVQGTDPEADLAVLKINLPNLPIIQLGDSKALRIGDVVLAIGNPFGVGQTVTLGIVSATGRSELGINTFENFIQTDAAINPGNSGGALITANGALIGVNTAIFSKSGGSQGIGFAIPVNLAKSSMKQIVETGHVSRGWLGIEIQEVTPDLAESFGLENSNGVIIAGVLTGGPADKAGIKAGDILINFNSQPITNPVSALNLISQSAPNHKQQIVTIRAGKRRESMIQIGERPQRDK
ncbi:MAG: trypsin-like peptidase domain-containing protein [Chromatiales bacterium]|nr:trypsin-like peptidase domain-containing protein [Chromatiales bacterium]